MILWLLKYDAAVSDFFIWLIALAYIPTSFPSIYISELSYLELTEAPRFAVGIYLTPGRYRSSNLLLLALTKRRYGLLSLKYLKTRKPVCAAPAIWCGLFFGDPGTRVF